MGRPYPQPVHPKRAEKVTLPYVAGARRGCGIDRRFKTRDVGAGSVQMHAKSYTRERSRGLFSASARGHRSTSPAAAASSVMSTLTVMALSAAAIAPTFR